MKRYLMVVAVVMLLVLAAKAFAQGRGAHVGGIAPDRSEELIPGVE